MIKRGCVKGILTQIHVGHDAGVEEGNAVNHCPQEAFGGDEVVDGLRVWLEALGDPCSPRR